MRRWLMLCCTLALACSSSGNDEPDAGTDVVAIDLPAEVAPDALPDMAVDETTPEDAVFDLPAQPTCLPPLVKGLTLTYDGPDADETVFPDNTEFYALVDETLADAAEGDPALTLSREEYPIYDFQVEDSPKGRLTWEYSIRHNHFGILDYMQGFEAYAAAHADDPVAQLSFLADKVDAFVTPDSVSPLLARADELASQPAALGCALALLNGTDASEGPLVLDGLAAVPEPLQQPLARALFALYFAQQLQHEAFAPAQDTIPFDQALYDKAVSKSYGAYADNGLEAVGDLVDFRQLIRGAQVATAAAQKLSTDPALAQLSEMVEFATPLGTIRLAGATDDVHHGSEGPYFLLVDGGGNDRYYGSIAASLPGAPIAIVVDGAGDDVYETTQADPTIGAGHLGYGILVDADGGDEYRGRYESVAAATLGVGVVIDGGGSDFYDGIANCQASSALGLALLMDLDGDDHYYAFRGSQAYAAYRGGSLLLDVAGNDLFEAEDDLVLYPAAQNPNFNGNMCQGAGQGFRNDNVEFTDTYCGGIAILTDLAGDDVYTGAIFAQGVGYWFGAGFLIDAQGNDSYSGVWYNFGASAHFAGAGHLDSGGQDDYFCLQDQCMGEGRDYSIAVMANLGGNDQYHAKGGRNIGAGDLFGAGIFWDDEGDDGYTLETQWGIGYAFAEKFAEYSFTFGLFMDSGGTEDTYDTPATHPANDTLWTQLGNPNDEPEPRIQAIGADR